jgi:hypothetical protein
MAGYISSADLVGNMERDTRADLAVSDYSQLGALREFLGWAVPGIRVLLIPGRPAGSGRDILALLADRDGLLAALRILPEFLRSRQGALSIAVTVKGTSVVLTAANVEDVTPILERLLDG